MHPTFLASPSFKRTGEISAIRKIEQKFYYSTYNLSHPMKSILPLLNT